jgi:hypothetical protein
MFQLGNLVMTSGVSNWIDNIETHKKVVDCIRRHQSRDWGEVDEEDWETNNFSIKNDLRVLSSYTINNQKIWIITEADRSVTTVLFPGEY